MAKVSAGVVAAISLASSLLGLGLGVPAAYAALSEAGLVQPDVDVVARPVDDLMIAWATLDFALYEAQWHPDATQQFGQGPSKNLSQILDTRGPEFEALLAVRVLEYDRCVVASRRDDEITLRVRYKLVNYWPEGDGVEADAQEEVERFVVRFNSQARRYQIVENTDPHWEGVDVCTPEAPDNNARSGWLAWFLG